MLHPHKRRNKSTSRKKYTYVMAAFGSSCILKRSFKLFGKRVCVCEYRSTLHSAYEHFLNQKFNSFSTHSLLTSLPPDYRHCVCVWIERYEKPNGGTFHVRFRKLSTSVCITVSHGFVFFFNSYRRVHIESFGFNE